MCYLTSESDIAEMNGGLNMSRTIVGGCGIAGSTFACALKEMLPEEEIILMDRENTGLYSRIRIPEVLSGKLPEEKLTLATPEGLQEKGIQTLFGVKLESIDTISKTIFYTGGSLKYDRFVFATGAQPSLPPIPGLTSEMTLRNLEDLHRIKAELPTAGNVLVIGGGLLGLEIAEAVKANRVAVTVSEIAERLLPAILNEKESAWLKDYLTGLGLEIITSGKIDKVTGANGKYQVLLNGSEREFGLVLVSAGICSNTEIAKAAGLNVNRGICINDRFETSAPDVYAIGDCAELSGRVYGLWMASKSQGTALASILAGKAENYAVPVFSPVPKLPGISFKVLKEKAAES